VSASPHSSWPLWKAVFCLMLLVEWVVNTQFVANILFIDEAGFTSDSTVNSHTTHVWGDGSPHATVASRC
jgi:hypothetical protein